MAWTVTDVTPLGGVHDVPLRMISVVMACHRLRSARIGFGW
jgi:hypothetical protein